MLGWFHKELLICRPKPTKFQNCNNNHHHKKSILAILQNSAFETFKDRGFLVTNYILKVTWVVSTIGFLVFLWGVIWRWVYNNEQIQLKRKMMKNRQKIVKKGENRQNTILRKISFKIRFSIKSMKLGCGCCWCCWFCYHCSWCGW